MKIAVEGNLAQNGSYGIVNLNLARALVRRGHKVSLIGFDILKKPLMELIQDREGLEIGDPGERQDVRIRQIWPPIWTKLHSSEKLIVIQPWEFGSIPIKWLEGIECVDAIWVPSEYCKRGYIQSGVSADKVWVVPNGCDVPPTIVRPTENNDEITRLVYVGGTIGRKGIDVLVRAMGMLNDISLRKIELTIKESGGDSFYRGQSVLGAALKENPRVSPRVNLVTTYLERADLLGLIRDADYFVQPYRAEGFAIPVLEAMAIGTPVIHTKGGATNEFLREEESIMIPSKLTVGEPPLAGDLLLADRQYWLEPSAEELAGILGRITDKSDSPAGITEMAKKRASEYTWDRVGEIADAAINAVTVQAIPSDRLSQLEKNLLALASGESANGVKLLADLVSIGDLTTATLAAEYLEKTAPPELAENFSQALANITKTANQVADVWSRAPYRAIAAKLSNRKNGKYGYVHEFEGDDSATYAIAKHISGYLTTCKSVLDIGCGQGSMMRVLRNAGKNVTGIEVDPMLVGKLHNDGFTVFEGCVPDDMDKYELPNFDGVFMGHIVEHMMPADLEKILNWVYENIDDDGVILIQTPDFSNPSVSRENFWLDSSHVRPYPVPLLKAMLAQSGFSPIEGGCRKIPEVAPLDAIALARKVALATHATKVLPAGSKKTIVHYALSSGTSGFANASRQLLDHKALSDKGWEITSVALNPEPGWQISDHSLDIEAAKKHEFEVAVVDAPLLWIDKVIPHIRAKKKVVRTTFEAEPLPIEFRSVLSQFDEIWTFSNYDAEIFKDAGLDKEKIHIVPPLISTPDANAIRTYRESVEYRYPQLLSIFNFEPRKNPAALLKTFAICAAKDENLKLTVKTSGVEVKDFVDWMNAVLTKEEFDLIKFRLTVIPQRLNDKELQTLYLNHDIFVLPTRGEGFGIPFIEAMSYGMTVVCPDTGGHRDVGNESNSIIARSSLAPVLPEPGAEPFIGCYWRDIDINDLASKLLETTANKKQRITLRNNGFETIATWNSRIPKAAERIEDVVNQGADNEA